jgi:tRNA threonylcarbamoyl adenosine modification protein YjeE
VEVFLLDGFLGAGNPGLARAIIRARLDEPELAVPSPTFALVQPYMGIVHADLYRLSHADELEELGIFDDDKAIRLIVWPGRAPHLADMEGVEITLEMASQGEGRIITILPIGGKVIDHWADPLSRWAKREGDR